MGKVFSPPWVNGAYLAEICHGKKIPLQEAHCSLAQLQLNEGELNLDFQTEPSQHLLDLVCQFSEAQSFNFLEFQSLDFFQITFFIEDEGSWVRVHAVHAHKEGNKHQFWFPVLYTKAVQIVFSGVEGLLAKLSLRKLNFQLKSELRFKASSQFDRLWVAENLIDGREDYGWCSLPSEVMQPEFLEIDLGMPYYITRLSLCSVDENPPCFPRNFSIAFSFDHISWENIINESNFFVSPKSWYTWNFSITRARYVKILINQTYPRRKKEFVAKLLELRVYAVAENFLLPAMEKNVYASELVPGIVQLSELGGTSPNKVVQANDPRLRLAGTEFPGIVQLAKDNQVGENLAVQANDSRLRLGTENYPGIVQLAKHGEFRSGVAVQGDDPRLRLATVEYPGIVQLAKDGESRPGLAVQANDSRLQVATEKSFGIVRLAVDGSTQAGEVVQANDSRLRKATISWPGIVQLAAHGEKASQKALQSDDPRLNEGDEDTKGRVQFARGGEKAPFKAVQANDPRLDIATYDSEGIVRFARPGQSIAQCAVEATDPRLSDPRPPLPHEHDYAAKNHEFSEHTGNLHINRQEKTPDPEFLYFSGYSQLPFSVQNRAGWAGGMEGGFFSIAENRPAIMALCDKQKALLAQSREGEGAVFFSEKNWAIYIPKKLGQALGSSLALFSEGKVLLTDTLLLKKAANICVFFNEFSTDVFSEGDLLTVDEQGKITKMKKPSDLCIGVFTKNPGIILADMSHSTEAIFEKGLVAIQGIVWVRVLESVRAGDRVGFSGKIPGVGKANAQNPLFLSLETNSEVQEKLIRCTFLR